MLELGLGLESLMCSKVFEYEFELAEWPSLSTCDMKMRKPYNGTIFQLRNYYHTIFPELSNEKVMNAEDHIHSTDTVYKVVYKVNLLGTIKPHGEESLVDVLKNENRTMQEL